MAKQGIAPEASTSHGEIIKSLADRRLRTAPRLRDELGLSDAGARKSCGDLVDAGLVVASEPQTRNRTGSNTRGPAPRPYGLNADRGRIVVLELGQQELRWALTDLTGNTVAEKSAPRSMSMMPRETLRLLREEVTKLDGYNEESIWCLATSFAGPIDSLTGSVVDPNWHSAWDGFALEGEFATWFPDSPLTRRTGRLPVRVTNDGLAAAYGSYAELSERGEQPRRLVGVDLNVGIGSGIVLGGTPMREATASLGHTVVDRNQVDVLVSGETRSCSCRHGKHHLSSYAAGWALAENFFGNGTDSTVSDFAVAYRQDDQRAQAALRECGNLLGASLASISAFLSPDVFVLSGLLATLDGSRNPIRDRIEMQIRDSAPLAATRALRVLIAGDPMGVGRRGASLMALHAVCEQPFLPALLQLGESSMSSGRSLS